MKKKLKNIKNPNHRIYTREKRKKKAKEENLVRDFIGLERISCSERVHRFRKKEIQWIRSQIQKKNVIGGLQVNTKLKRGKEGFVTQNKGGGRARCRSKQNSNSFEKVLQLWIEGY